MKPSRRFFLWGTTALALVATTHLASGQGTLAPSAAPAPTMKSLDQIDAHIASGAADKRTPVNSTTAPGDGSDVYIITQPGSYYPAGNVSGVDSGKNGISISADDVTLDLNGLSVHGGLGSSNGIQSTGKNVCIRNGTVRSWGGDGVYLAGSNEILEGLHVSDNVGNGINAPLDVLVIRRCMVASNSHSGMTFDGGSLTDCTATSNSSAGFYTPFGTGATIKNCAALSNLFGRECYHSLGSKSIVILPNEL